MTTTQSVHSWNDGPPAHPAATFSVLLIRICETPAVKRVKKQQSQLFFKRHFIVFSLGNIEVAAVCIGTGCLFPM